MRKVTVYYLDELGQQRDIEYEGDDVHIQSHANDLVIQVYKGTIDRVVEKQAQQPQDLFGMSPYAHHHAYDEPDTVQTVMPVPKLVKVAVFNQNVWRWVETDEGPDGASRTSQDENVPDHV